METLTKYQNSYLTTSVRQIENKLLIDVRSAERNLHGSYLISHTKHSRLRAAQRGIKSNAIALALEYGTVIQKQGLDFYVVRNDSLPKGARFDAIKNLVVVAAGASNEILTVYKNSNCFRRLSKKKKYLSKGS